MADSNPIKLFLTLKWFSVGEKYHQNNKGKRKIAFEEYCWNFEEKKTIFSYLDVIRGLNFFKDNCGFDLLRIS